MEGVRGGQEKRRGVGRTPSLTAGLSVKVKMEGGRKRGMRRKRMNRRGPA